MKATKATVAKPATTASTTGSDARSATKAITSGADRLHHQERTADAAHQPAVAVGAEQRQRHARRARW